MGIKLQRVSKWIGDVAVLRDISIEFAPGELVALLGPSGSGKTSLLRLIAGFEAIQEGQLAINGQDATGSSVGDRQVGFVFQHYALFNHMTVFDNIAFGLRVRPRSVRPSKREIYAKVMQLLELVQLSGFEQRLPMNLSGGQRQRVALARALAIEPKMLLLDEPFGALDAKVRLDLRRWVRQLHDELQLTTIFVTHDQEEALEIADKVVILNQGRIEQAGTPSEVYHHPVNPFVYNFLGRVSTVGQIGPSEEIGYVRPHEMDVQRNAHDGDIVIPAVVAQVMQVGPVVRLVLERQDTKDLMEAEMGEDRYGDLGLQPKEKVYVTPRNLRFFTENRDTAKESAGPIQIQY